MAKILQNYLAVLLFGLSFVFAAHAQKQVVEKDLPNFSQVNERLYRGGQPTEAGVKMLAEKGIKTIINLRGEDETSRKEQTWAQNVGIKFISISLQNWFKPSDSNIEEILKMLDTTANQPVFVHCKRGADRTGTVIAVYRLTHDRWTAKQAIREAKTFDMGWWQIWMKDYIRDYSKKFSFSERVDRQNLFEYPHRKSE